MRIEMKIREIRESKNISLDELAKMTGVSKGHLSKIERGEVSVSLLIMMQISFALKVDIKELYKVIK